MLETIGYPQDKLSFKPLPDCLNDDNNGFWKQLHIPLPVARPCSIMDSRLGGNDGGLYYIASP
jgi:hypothetical protein